MEAFGYTDVGMVRKENQDNYKIISLNDKTILAIVCDGMGGAQGGEVASHIAACVISESIKEDYENQTSKGIVFALLMRAFKHANNEILKVAKKDSSFRGMGTTAVAAIINGKKAYIASVGDSRAYLMDDKEIKQITKDHSIVQHMIDSGTITRFEAKSHPKRHIITKAIGIVDYFDPDCFEITLNKNEILLICTDGLYSHLDDSEIEFELRNNDNTGEVVQKLVTIANEKGGTDNTTVVAVKI